MSAQAGEMLVESPAPATRPSHAAEVEEFVGTLRADRTGRLHRAAAEATALHETSFFRESVTFDLLRVTILARLIAAIDARRTLRVWSAAGSTGQEAYSVAMLIREHFAELAEWDVKIIGTDLSGDAIDRARRGRYRRLEVNRGLPARMLVKYLARDGDEWEIHPGLRSMCEFKEADLCAPLPELPQFDLVLLRNVLLYLSQADRSAAFASVRRQMAPEAVLVLGAAEQAEDSTTLFQAVFARECCYYRPAA